VVDRTGSFSSAFLIAAAGALVGALACGVIVRRIETIDWRATDSRGQAAAVPQQG
jgi:hypothetical protein